ncbi:hypothetical protein [Thalassospira marina]|uniref:hypothetical protein n=1 Tax=Thalassospira marina TaxID=2048283 RepID=UPI0012FF2898|nr:hypothetical protein [Thalassospira marina]
MNNDATRSTAQTKLTAAARSPLQWIMLCLVLLGLTIIGGSLATSTTGITPETFSPHAPTTRTYGFPEKQGVLPAGGDYYVLTSRHAAGKKHPPFSDPSFNAGANQTAQLLVCLTSRFCPFSNDDNRVSRSLAPYAPRSPPFTV